MSSRLIGDQMQRDFKQVVVSLCFVLLLSLASGCKQNVEGTDPRIFEQAVAHYKAKEYKDAFDLFHNLAEKGNPGAQGFVGLFYQHGYGVEANPQKAIHWYELSADSGHTTAMVTLGEMYFYGEGVVRDCSRAVGLYELAANGRNTVAMYYLSSLHSGGLCVELNKEKSIHYLKNASYIDDEYGVLCKALLLYHYGGEENYKGCVDQFHSIASKYNNRTAYHYLYRVYISGRGVSVNSDKAVDYLKISSDLGLPAAHYSLALNYLRGDILSRNYDLAYEYAMKSANKHSGSAYVLGVLYEHGFGVPVDIEESKKWYRKAIDMGNEKAKKRLSALEQ